LDRFIFKSKDYSILEPVRNLPFDKVPLPFSECRFVFYDTRLMVDTTLSGSCLKMRFYTEFEEWGKASMPINAGAWIEGGGVSVSGPLPGECVGEFIRLYRYLSIFLAQRRPVNIMTQREFIEKELGEKIKESSIPKSELDDRIISLGKISPVIIYKDAEEHIAPHKEQENPCQHAFWVRGHNRTYRSGLVTWVRPHTRNNRYPLQDKAYSL